MPLMVPCFGCGFEPELVYSPYDYDSKTGSLFHLVASGGPTFSWSMSWAQIPKNGLFSS